MFEFNPLEVGNLMTLGMLEEEFEQEVDNMVSASKLGYVFFLKDIYNLLGKYNVKYETLPKWIKDKIDEIELA